MNESFCTEDVEKFTCIATNMVTTGYLGIAKSKMIFIYLTIVSIPKHILKLMLALGPYEPTSNYENL